ncbi:MAG: acetoacetate--CoA ligase [Saprospiraceae bacterium]
MRRPLYTSNISVMAMNNDPIASPRLLWQPARPDMQSSHLAQYVQWLSQHVQPAFLQKHGLHGSFDPEKYDFSGGGSLYHDLWQWSTEQPDVFWESIWSYFRVISHSDCSAVQSKEEMPGVRWFEGATLNYAEHVFRQKTAQRPAILFKNERNPLEEISWAELESRTASLAAWLRAQGIGRGDRVAAYLPNSPHAVVAVLACMSIGAVWSSCSPDFGAASVADRFAQIEPRVLITCDGYAYGGKSFDKSDTVRELCGLLPSVEKVLWVPYLDAASAPHGIPNASLWDEALNAFSCSVLDHFEALPFSHPLWVLYSSGTTGVPKAITHSHGGNLLEHLKYLHLHNDVRPGERFFWFSTTGWMMWNFTVGALLTGATIVLYDGSPGYPDLSALWALAETARITHFGTSAPFLVSCRKAALSPRERFDLSGMRSIGSTGSPLPPEAFDWVYEHIGKKIWLSSMAGGTDVCTAWVGGCPLLPVWQGEIQCICLGCAMEAWDEDGRPLPNGEVGEMVVTKAMPSMPVFFWNDTEGQKYRSSYFEQWPGVWRHGDWIRLTDRGTVVILGRSDATLNRQGVRIGTAEIYRALDQLPELRDTLIVNLERADGTDWMPLFVVLNPGQTLDEALKNKIRHSLRTAYSPRHVPDDIIVAPDIPYTISGKKMETPVKKILLRRPLDKAYNRDSMRNPEAMDFFLGLAAELNWGG